jgi:hypothetical protein
VNSHPEAAISFGLMTTMELRAAGDWGGPWAEIKWLAKDHLLIRYAAKSRLFEQKDGVSGVRISYQQVDR